MDLNKIAELKAALGLDKVEDHIAAQKQADLEARQKAADKERDEKEAARMQELVDKAVGEQKAALGGALELIEEVTKKLGDNDIAGMAKAIESLQGDIAAKSDEIAQLLAARDGFTPAAASVKRAFGQAKEVDLESEAEKAVFLGYLLNKEKDALLDTNFGASVREKVNTSSNIEVSSDEYETIFSRNILRDIQERLVVGAMFPELPMSAANITMPIEPTAQKANWVAATTYGTDATTGNEINVTLTEITFSTFKLAAKAYITDETTEDAIIPLLPILRRHLVEAHARAIEDAFMTGTGTGQPKGLLPLASDDSNKVTTTATHTATVKVQAKMLHQLRRRLGTKGLRMSDLSLIVSEDAYFDLIEDEAFQDVDQVGQASLKLQGQIGRVYGMPVVSSEWFPAKASGAEFAVLVYMPDFVVPRQRQVTVERERRPREQRDAYYATQRVNLQRYFTGDNVATAAYA